IINSSKFDVTSQHLHLIVLVHRTSWIVAYLNSSVSFSSMHPFVFVAHPYASYRQFENLAFVWRLPSSSNHRKHSADLLEFLFHPVYRVECLTVYSIHDYPFEVVPYPFENLQTLHSIFVVFH